MKLNRTTAWLLTLSFATSAVGGIGANASIAEPIPDAPIVTGIERPSGAGAFMGQAGKDATDSTLALARPMMANTEPTVDEQPAGTKGNPLGLDVSGWQKNVDWAAVKKSGAKFTYIKTSEGPWTLNDYFNQQYNGSTAAGLLRGGYHFARPNLSNGASQAQVMLESGGGWSADGITLPPALDIEDNPYVASDKTNNCYGMTPPQLVRWIQDFASTIKAKAGTDALIYTSYYFWQECLGGSSAFANSNPLWIAAYYASSPWMPGKWPQYTIWQYADNFADQGQQIPATFPGDQNVFNGSMDQLRKFAKGTYQPTQPPTPTPSPAPTPKPPATAPQPISPTYLTFTTPAGAKTFSGKWNGDGKSYVGWMLNGRWCLQNLSGKAPNCFGFGSPGDQPVVGDWNGNGTASIGIVRAGKWYLSNSPFRPTIDYIASFGEPTDIALTGDWDGNGKTSIGIFRNGLWALSNSISGGAPVAHVVRFGQSGDQPLIGNWNGTGKAGIGIFRGTVFALNNSVASSQVTDSWMFGELGDKAIVGDWDGNKSTTIGIFRSGQYALTNNNAKRTIDIVIR
ncbi:GH25 family lysozyme [Arthrobacter sp. lap29]|uniref:GH25 family lysozyme n=1 Tax=Arthrobacter sp. lap29 TaxID=3056122 RepID=UPI0028F7051F|nr:GH25 family lysozyme [Arthrobacter sp. lap29]